MNYQTKYVLYLDRNANTAYNLGKEKENTEYYPCFSFIDWLYD